MADFSIGPDCSINWPGLLNWPVFCCIDKSWPLAIDLKEISPQNLRGIYAMDFPFPQNQLESSYGGIITLAVWSIELQETV